MAPILEVRDLSHIYSVGTPFQRAAIEHVNFSVERGEFIGVIGHTGSGKSTLIQHLNGLLKPTSGQILFDGRDIWSDKAFTRSIRFQVGLVFQYPEYQLFEETVYKDIAFGPKNMGLPPEEIRRRVLEAAAFVGVPEEHLDKSPFDLSGGQKRRVAIAGVLAMRPEVLILDEPTAGLDPKGRDEILDLLKSLHDGKKLTIIIVSHSMEDMARYVGRIVVMNYGEKVFDGTPKEVFRHYRELEAMGLAAPQITYVVQELRARGVDIADDITTIEEARDAILALLAKEKL